MNSKKTLVITAICFPPCLIGPAILMGNLFRHFPKGSYHVLMGLCNWLPIDDDSKLQAPYTYTRYPNLNYRGNLFRLIYSILHDLFAILEITIRGLIIIKKENINHIFAIADHYVEIAALLMHWLTGKKIVVWFPDLYYHNDHISIPKAEQIFNRFLEPLILKSANNVLVASEETQKYYKEKYGIKTNELRHSVELNRYNKLPNEQPKNDLITIVYTGIITHAHYDSILDMVSVVEGFNDINIKFLLVTTTPPENLIQMGIKGKKVIFKLANRREIPEIQKSADILFLPLAFEYYSDLNVRTASPSKLPEYLAAGRPILVYAPSHSYYAKYAGEHKFAVVVDNKNPDQLEQVVLEMINDENLRNRLGKTAIRVAKEFHDSEKISKKLQTILGIT